MCVCVCVCVCVRVRPASQISESSEFSRFSNFRVPEWGCQGGGSALEGAQGGVRKMGARVRFDGVLCGYGARPDERLGDKLKQQGLHPGSINSPLNLHNSALIRPQEELLV